jgi:hypothetical protein
MSGEEEKETEIIIKPKDAEEAIVMLSAYKMQNALWEIKHNFWRNWKHDEESLTLDDMRQKLRAIFIDYEVDDITEF